MKSVVFEEHAGWFHPAREQPAGTGRSPVPGVVICNPLGHEAMWLHNAQRQLAERLAARGVPVLRFDYINCGDSADAGIDCPLQGVEEISCAITFLKGLTAVDAVALAGFRFGATFAALAAQSLDIEAIAMFAPIVSGRIGTRELKVLQQTWIERSAPAVTHDNASQDCMTVLGHRFSLQGFSALGKVDLRTASSAPARRVLLLHVDPRDPSHELAEHYRSLGAAVESHPFDEYAAALQPSWLAAVPDRALDIAVDWFVRTLAAPAADPATVVPAATTVSNGAQSLPEPVLMLHDATERPVRFGEQDRLFGVLCEPHEASHGASRDPSSAMGRGPAVLIANTAATHHVGDGRFNVELARYLAHAGYTSLRMDADPLGESAGAAARGPCGTVRFEDLACDVSHAANWLAARGHSHVAVFGICSGAYIGLRAAVRNPAIDGLMLANLVGFTYPDDYTMADARESGAGSTGAHFRSMWRAKKWAQVLRGEVSLAPVMRTLWSFGAAQALALLAALSRDALGGGTPARIARKQMRELDARGVHVQLLYSAIDPGLDALHLAFGNGGKHLAKLERARVATLHSMDHEVLNPVAREQVASLCTKFLDEAFSGVGARGAHASRAERHSAEFGSASTIQPVGGEMRP
jgi:alpha/beta superfamily hydrolase